MATIHPSLAQLAPQHSAQTILASSRDEIERAVANVKRSELDRWWRRQFYRETWKMGRRNGWRKLGHER